MKVWHVRGLVLRDPAISSFPLKPPPPQSINVYLNSLYDQSSHVKIFGVPLSFAAAFGTGLWTKVDQGMTILDVSCSHIFLLVTRSYIRKSLTLAREKNLFKP